MHTRFSARKINKMLWMLVGAYFLWNLDVYNDNLTLSVPDDA